MRDAIRAYRESVVAGASPVGLVVILYEEVQRTICKAVRGIEQHNIEQRTVALSQAIKVIGHLEAVLDYEAGGEVARNLARFYNVARAKILESSFRSDAGALESLASDFANLTGAWKQVELEVGGESGASNSSGSGTGIAAEVARALELATDEVNGSVRVEG